MSDSEHSKNFLSIGWLQPVIFTAMAGGLGWGIRGQYGHETGAMIAGVLVSLTLVFLLCPGASSLQVVRAVALGTIAMGFGGTMTYGQTVGLTHDTPLVGNWAAFRWGMLGLAIKGGIWIGFAGFFLGLGLGGRRYRPVEMLLLLLHAVCGFCRVVAFRHPPRSRKHATALFLFFRPLAVRTGTATEGGPSVPARDLGRAAGCTARCGRLRESREEGPAGQEHGILGARLAFRSVSVFRRYTRGTRTSIPIPSQLRSRITSTGGIQWRPRLASSWVVSWVSACG